MMRWPLVLIHGYPFDHSMWDAVVKELEGKARVVVPDLPGFAGTPVSKLSPSMDHYADFVAECLDREGIPAAVVAGMSMGGYVALSFAENYPERLAGLGLVATQAIADTEEARKGRLTMIEKIRQQGPQVAAEAITPKLFAPRNLQDPTLLQFPRNGAAAAGVEGLCWALQAMASRPNREFVLLNLECPSSVLRGTEDKIISHEQSVLMARETKAGEFLEVGGAGHALPMEAPAIVAERLLSLLSRAESFQPHKHTYRPPIDFAPTEKGL
jgi:3-oxoadipate enol-lactonase